MKLHIINSAFCLFTFGLILLLVGPVLARDGMFMDGLLYTTVSSMLAEGHGTWWMPRYSETMHLPFFREQPPLAFWIQAMLFRIFGDHIYVERAFSFACALGTAGCIMMVWREACRHTGTTRYMAWWPVVLWITIPVVFWSYANNMLENLMAVFVLLAMYLQMRAWRASGHVWIWMAASGFFVAGAMLTKGFPGMFPLVFTGLYWLTHRQISFLQALGWSTIMVAVLTVIFSLLWLHPDARTGLGSYLEGRVLNSIQNVATVSSRFYIVQVLFLQTLPAFSIALFARFIGRTKNSLFKGNEETRFALLFFFLGLTGTLPLMVTLEQRGFYIVSALPCFALSAALTGLPGTQKLVEYFGRSVKRMRTVIVISVVLVLTATLLTVKSIGEYRAHAQELSDVYAIGPLLPRGATISTDNGTWHRWHLHSYFLRHFRISLSTKLEYKYLLWAKEDSTTVPFGYKLIKSDGNIYTLYTTEQE